MSLMDFFRKDKKEHFNKKDQSDIIYIRREKIENINPDKPTILIIDDNEGVVSFLYDDIESIFEDHNINIEDYNILLLDGSLAAFELEQLLKMKNLNIRYAVIDITLGGSILRDGEIIKYTGVDVFSMIKSEELKYIFYTGNNLNTYIKQNVKLMKQFEDLTNEDIKDHLLMKTSVDMDTRREILYKLIKD